MDALPKVRKTDASAKKRAVLNDQQVRNIFQLKLPSTDKSNHHQRGRSALVSRVFRISPKAVRDILNYRTWRHITLKMIENQNCQMHDENPASSASSDMATCLPSFINAGSLSNVLLGMPTQSRIGRPPGSKDRQPRRKRTSKAEQQMIFGLPSEEICTCLESIFFPEKKTLPKCEDFKATDIGSVRISSFQDTQPAADEEALLSRTYPFFLSTD